MKNRKVQIIIFLVILILFILGVFYFVHPHKYKENVIAKATCTEEGVLNYSCWCGSAYEEHTASLGHDYESQVTTEATCAENGIRTYTCTRCNDTYTEEIKATGHDYVEEAIEKPGYICKVCVNCKAVVEERDAAFWENLIIMYSLDACDVYETPSTDAPILGQFAKGDEVEVSVIEDDWATVVLDDGTGYVRADLLSDTKPVESAPATTENNGGSASTTGTTANTGESASTGTENANTGDSTSSTDAGTSASTEATDPTIGKTGGTAYTEEQTQALIQQMLDAGAAQVGEFTPSSGVDHVPSAEELGIDNSGITLH